MGEMKLLCFAEGRGASFEAICIDLDISVQGSSFQEVYQGLNEAIRTYIEDAEKEDEAQMRRLLTRRAPWYVRAGYVLRFFSKVIARRHRDGSQEASFDVVCPA